MSLNKETISIATSRLWKNLLPSSVLSDIGIRRANNHKEHDDSAVGHWCEEKMTKIAGIAIGYLSPTQRFSPQNRNQRNGTHRQQISMVPFKMKNVNAKRPQYDFCKQRGFESTHGEDVCWRKEAYLRGKQDAAAESILTVKYSSNNNNSESKTTVKAIMLSSLRVSIPPSTYSHVDSGCTKLMTDTSGTRTIEVIEKKLAFICFRYWRCLNTVSSKW
jgi:hypothetical protein